ncbi:MAG: hypothetical protein RLZZ210_1616 [Pseudomonadota bacterium]|jgi:predicted nucleic acid-binding protein
MILADTSVWIDYFNGVNANHTDALDYELQHGIVITGDLIIVEFLQGFKNDIDYAHASNLIQSLKCYSLVGLDIALKSAQNFRYLRTKGITIRKTIDVIIATFCIENNVKLIHNDRDFDPIEIHLGLQVRK